MSKAPFKSAPLATWLESRHDELRAVEDLMRLESYSYEEYVEDLVDAYMDGWEAAKKAK